MIQSISGCAEKNSCLIKFVSSLLPDGNLVVQHHSSTRLGFNVLIAESWKTFLFHNEECNNIQLSKAI